MNYDCPSLPSAAASPWCKARPVFHLLPFPACLSRFRETWRIVSFYLLISFCWQLSVAVLWNNASKLLGGKSFCPAMLCISAAIAFMRCPSVRPSVTFVDHVKTNKDIFEIFSPSGSHTILVFPYQTGWRYSHGNPPNGGVECRWGIGRNHDSGLIAGYRRLLHVRIAKNIYRRRSWVYDTVGHAPLAIDRLLDVRTTKWQKQLPTTMQCRSDSRRLTSECDGLQHGRIRRREDNREFNCTQWYIWSRNN